MKRKNSIQENFSIQNNSIGDLTMEDKDYSLNINGQDVVFESHPNWANSIKATLRFANGYDASIITKRSGEDQEHDSWSAGGNWDNMTFEVALLKDGQFLFDEEIEDLEYKYNGGVWKYIHLKDMNEILYVIRNR